VGQHGFVVTSSVRHRQSVGRQFSTRIGIDDQGLLRESSLSPEFLIVEITESVALVDIDETMTVLENLGHLGVGIALDDFGTGFSSLSYLARLNPDHKDRPVLRTTGRRLSSQRHAARDDHLHGPETRHDDAR